MHLTLDLPQLRLIVEAYMATLPRSESEEAEEMPALAKKLLDQAQSQVGEAQFEIQLEPSEAKELSQALEAQLELAAEEGDIYLLGEIPRLIAQLED